MDEEIGDETVEIALRAYSIAERTNSHENLQFLFSALASLTVERPNATPMQYLDAIEQTANNRGMLF